MIDDFVHLIDGFVHMIDDFVVLVVRYRDQQLMNLFVNCYLVVFEDLLYLKAMA